MLVGKRGRKCFQSNSTDILSGGEPTFYRTDNIRHWYVCQMMRLIHEIAETPGEVERRKEEMVRYMAWRSPDTLQAYEHYFQAIHHAQMQDVLHQQLDNKLKDYIESARRKERLSKGATESASRKKVNDQEVGWGSLLDFGGEGYE